MSGPGLGRLFKADNRDKEHLMPRRQGARSMTSKYWWTPPKPYDQGSTSQCVAYSGVRYLVSSPVANKAIDFVELYKDCKANDEWPGENYEGTSVRGLFKVFEKRGIVSSYSWAFDKEPVIDHLLTVGPVVLGTLWTDCMGNISSKTNFLEVDPDDKLRRATGGHAWCAYGANRKRKCPDGSMGAIRAINSWGEGWGEHGRFWVSFNDLDRLLKNEGEACVSTEVKISALTDDIPWIMSA